MENVITIKKQAFEYFLSQIQKWGIEKNNYVQYYPLTRLKALKLLFFTAAVKNEDNQDLLDVFDNFYALPNGPVESDIYNLITSDMLSYYSFKDFYYSVKKPYNEDDLSDDMKNRIDLAIKTLKQKNKLIVSYTAEQLVTLSHTWLSWQTAIQIGKALGKGSYHMDVAKIRSNNQFFIL